MRRPAEARSRPTVRRLGCGTPARRGGGASPTTYRGMCRARGAGRRAKTRGCGTTRPKKGEGRAAELDQGGHTRPRSGPHAGRNPFRRGGLLRTRPRRRTGVRRAGRRTSKTPVSKGEHGCPDRGRRVGRPGRGGRYRWREVAAERARRLPLHKNHGAPHPPSLSNRKDTL